MVLPTLVEEQQLWSSGYNLVCGVDEVGRGCFAGPVVVGAVIFPKNCSIISGVADSKLLTAKQRDALEIKIKESVLCWAVAEVSVSTINKVGIGQATQIAFRKALRLLSINPDFVLIDAFYIRHLDRNKQKPIIKGDSLCYSIAAASIIAKVHRDRLMQSLHQDFPEYLWSKNKGYGTKAHRDVIKNNGLTKWHRKSFNLTKFL